MSRPKWVDFVIEICICSCYVLLKSLESKKFSVYLCNELPWMFSIRQLNDDILACTVVPDEIKTQESWY